MATKRNASAILDPQNNDGANKKQVTMKTSAGSSGTSMTASRANVKSYLTSPVIKITVGSENTQYHIHRALLTTYSSYFENCLDLGFLESQTSEVKLSEDSDIAFQEFVHWLYHGFLSASPKSFGFSQCIRLYRLADKLMIPTLKNTIVDVYRRGLRERCRSPNPDHIVRLHDIGLLHSKLGDFFLRSFVYGLSNLSSQNAKSQTIYQERHDKVIQTICGDYETLRMFTMYSLEYKRKPWEDPRYCVDELFHELEDGKKGAGRKVDTCREVIDPGQNLMSSDVFYDFPEERQQ